tara:strand:+ start:65 stop:355 length:291 start_codon:yes stop_codon:yes gene_type:complete
MQEVKVTVFEAGKSEGYIQSFPESPSLKDMQDLVGGYIQLVPLSDSEYMVCNEEGLINNLPINDIANEILQVQNPYFATYNVIVGDVFIIKIKDFE